VRHLRGLPFLIVAVALAAIVAGTAFAAAQTKVKFTGSYKGTVAEKVDGNKITARATGTGTGTTIGKGALAGSVTATTAADQPCAPFNGPGTLSGPKGKLKLTVLTGSRGCAASQDEKDSISLSGTAKVTGGTLKFKKAKGTLHFSGHYDRASGSFNVKLTGPLTY
jgi:hypothetical protein